MPKKNIARRLTAVGVAAGLALTPNIACGVDAEEQPIGEDTQAYDPNFPSLIDDAACANEQINDAAFLSTGQNYDSTKPFSIEEKALAYEAAHNNIEYIFENLGKSAISEGVPGFIIFDEIDDGELLFEAGEDDNSRLARTMTLGEGVCNVYVIDEEDGSYIVNFGTYLVDFEISDEFPATVPDDEELIDAAYIAQDARARFGRYEDYKDKLQASLDA